MHTLPATHNELAAWLRLSLATGLKPAALRLLLSAFGLPEAILQQDHGTLAAIAGEAAARAALAPTGPEFDAQLDAVVAWRELPGNHLVTLDDPAYPPALLTMPDPPPLLYIKGRLDLLHTRAVALVGSRSATPQGMEDAERFARTFATAGVTVVSGLAQGIDGAAHRGALEGVGSTVAVIGTGADLVYPAAHHALARQIAMQGAILSEWPLGTPARAANFPQRNRLIIKGRLDLLHTRAVALVGSRSATPQGMEDAERFARTFATAGVTVVSGLAQGIDGAAHRGALEGVGSTVAVIGTGADLVYPAAHHALARQIAMQGAILSEWPLGTPARAANFPQRNRLIAGLVSGVLIVEAAMRSGSLITARLANEMGRDIFALPGSIHAPLSRGCHRMIKQGAKLVETPDEVLEELGFVITAPVQASTRRDRAATQAPGSAAPDSAATARAQSEESTLTVARARASDMTGGRDPDAQRLLAALGYAPTPLEILATRTEMDYALLQTTLLQLELAGEVSALPGGRYTRASQGRTAANCFDPA
ncbi:DNA-processing protein DprA [Burkholderia sp. M6-3]